MSVPQMMKGKMTLTRNALPSGFAGGPIANPAAASDITAEVQYISSPELVEAEETIPVRGMAGTQDIGGQKSLSPFRVRAMSIQAGYLGRFAQFFSGSITWPLRDVPESTNHRNMVWTFTGKIRRRGAIERDGNAGGTVNCELEINPWVYHEQISGITPATVDYDWDDHFHVGGWDLDTDQAVSA